MSFLDNLEDNLKALESQEQGGLDQSKQREAARARALAVAPWAEKLKKEPWSAQLIRSAIQAGFSRRIKVNLAWLDTTLRLEARDQKLELRPETNGVAVVFLKADEETSRRMIDLTGDAKVVAEEWMAQVHDV